MKAARYYLVGATNSILAKRDGHSFFMFGDVTGEWKMSARAVNLITFEVALEIPKSEAEAYVAKLFPDGGVKL